MTRTECVYPVHDAAVIRPSRMSVGEVDVSIALLPNGKSWVPMSAEVALQRFGILTTAVHALPSKVEHVGGRKC